MLGTFSIWHAQIPTSRVRNKSVSLNSNEKDGQAFQKGRWCDSRLWCQMGFYVLMNHSVWNDRVLSDYVTLAFVVRKWLNTDRTLSSGISSNAFLLSGKHGRKMDDLVHLIQVEQFKLLWLWGFLVLFFFLSIIALFSKELYLQYVLLQVEAWCVSVGQFVTFVSHCVTRQ